MCAMYHKKLLLCYAMILLPQITYGKSAENVLVYPKPESSSDSRHVHYLETLELCLRKSGTRLKLKPSEENMQQGRSIFMLAQGKAIDVMWTMTSPEREKLLLPIRIPIDRGLLGWRLFLIRKEDQSRFNKIQTLSDLRKFSAGQGHDWPDMEILKTNGLSVIPSPTYDGLFRMLKMERFDFFPRSVIEIYEELESRHSFGIDIEKKIAIHYPATLYFFVNNQNTKLAKHIESGCKAAIKDGSFNKLFEKFYKSILTKSDIKNRRIFQLKNPLLPPKTPLDKKEFWYSP